MTGIGPRLKRERLRLKLSQSAMGAIGGVETNAQGNYENGIRSPRADYLSRISAAGVDVTYVVTGFSRERSISSNETLPLDSPELLNLAINRLHGSLHEVTQNLYHMARLVDARSQGADADKSQLEHIKVDAEAITIAAVRLIYMTSRLI
ncbi:XRE family transcriptional regulator [Pseudomonas sp. v388]|uniref:helix-turn-helix domain-containing protein n=1 Tax=Pseudomonas sp. v388 TaxID=2479849 RepID=UPI000F768F6A|nr:helix-turn-helix transcriptional regulator [Pseudomonas sp. v388]RRV05351.1 XRE family transcriptional regulator [Pseudomonas sp. v388]